MLSIKGYLERLELLRLGNLSVRVHWIQDIDRTPFLHTHPFSYLSIITRGGYTEELLVNGRLIERSHLAGSFILRRAHVPHRITAVKPGTQTVFFAYYHESWELIEHPHVHAPEGYYDLPDGMYRDSRNFKWKRRENRKWYTSEFDYKSARSTQRLSIFQNLNDEVLYQHALDTSEQSLQRSGLPGLG